MDGEGKVGAERVGIGEEVGEIGALGLKGGSGGRGIVSSCTLRRWGRSGGGLIEGRSKKKR